MLQREVGLRGMELLVDIARESINPSLHVFAAKTMLNLRHHPRNRTKLYRTELDLKGADWSTKFGPSSLGGGGGGDGGYGTLDGSSAAITVTDAGTLDGTAASEVTATRRRGGGGGGGGGDDIAEDWRVKETFDKWFDSLEYEKPVVAMANTLTKEGMAARRRRKQDFSKRRRVVRLYPGL